MHDTAEYTDEKEIVDQKAIELAEDFSYEGYQVVRRELFAHLREPSRPVTGSFLRMFGPLADFFCT